MEIYLPTLEQKILTLVESLRFIVFGIAVVGIIAYAARNSVNGVQLFRIIAKAIAVVAAIMSLG